MWFSLHHKTLPLTVPVEMSPSTQHFHGVSESRSPWGTKQRRPVVAWPGSRRLHFCAGAHRSPSWEGRLHSHLPVCALCTDSRDGKAGWAVTTVSSCFSNTCSAIRVEVWFPHACRLQADVPFWGTDVCFLTDWTGCSYPAKLWPGGQASWGSELKSERCPVRAPSVVCLSSSHAQSCDSTLPSRRGLSASWR